ncbi:MAG: hypothetical protein JSR64_17005 [Nitrospira sp.]|nr:hypothetical protein [Nitrospira sp.]
MTETPAPITLDYRLLKSALVTASTDKFRPVLRSIAVGRLATGEPVAVSTDSYILTATSPGEIPPSALPSSDELILVPTGVVKRAIEAKLPVTIESLDFGGKATYGETSETWRGPDGSQYPDYRILIPDALAPCDVVLDSRFLAMLDKVAAAIADRARDARYWQSWGSGEGSPLKPTIWTHRGEMSDIRAMVLVMPVNPAKFPTSPWGA